MDVPAGVTQETGHRGFLHLPCAVLALIFFEIKIQPSFNCSPLVEHFLLSLFFVRKRGRVTAPRFNLMSQRRRFRGYQLNHLGDRRLGITSTPDGVVSDWESTSGMARWFSW